MEFVEEKVDITALLQGILNGYPGNSAILREYLQNSDDAKAKSQIFVLDERIYPTDTLCDQSLCEAQGPALLAFNDGVLSERDWDALTTIHSSSKKADETQTGKNGLGFRASYHLTETPHVLSGGTLIILDPHRRLQSRNAGLKITIDEAGRSYPDQLKPFEHVREIFEPSEGVANSVSAQFQGTIFRLPLRTDIQAQQSRIKSSSTSVEEVRSLLQDFCQAELTEVILFLKHIAQIEVYHIDVSGNRTLFGRVSIENPPSLLEDLQSVYIRQTTCQKDGTVEKRRWYFRRLDIDKKEAAEVISDRLGYDVENSLTADKLFPSIELATPMDGEPITGSLFTLLPLPIKTYFPVHLNAVFALTPDRQSLKNIEEVGNMRSRERRLVEWNRAIFEVWAPMAWADLIEKLPSSHQPWFMWPPEEQSAYWKKLTTNLVRDVVLRHSPVFATIHKEVPSFISLEDANTLIAPPFASVDLLLLAALGMKIVQPPQHIFSILTSDQVSVSARELSPSTLHNVLSKGYQRGTWQPYNRSTIVEIIDYLVFSTSPPSLSNLEGLPWFENSDGTTVTLQRPGVGGTYIIPKSEEDAHLFASHPRMLAWSCLPEKLRIALLQSNSGALNVAPLGAEDVIHVLTARFTSRDDAVSGGFEASDVTWVLDFLSWLDLHQDLQCQLFDRNALLPSLFLLPTTTGLRRLSEKAIFMTDISVANAWETLGVPRLQNDLSTHVVTLLSNRNFVKMPKNAGFLAFVLDNSDPALQRGMSMRDFEALRRSIYSVVVQWPTLPPLTQGQKRVLEQLSVFSVRQITGGTTLSPVRGNRLHVNVPDDFPLPIQRTPTIHVDVRESETKAFIQLIEHMDEKGIWDFLQIAVEHWSDQLVDLQDRVIDCIFGHWMSLPLSVLEHLKKLPFVSVNGTDSRVPPTNLIHPASPITPLYEGEVGRIPSGRFAKQQYVTIMQDLGFLHSSLDSEILQERLNHLSNSLNDVKAFDKSLELVHLLNRFWERSFKEYIHLHRDSPWMPGTKPSDLVTPKRSRDLYVGPHADPNLYDFELKLFPEDVVYISEPKFREALGWSDPVPSHVLVEQFRKTISLPHDEVRYRRLKILIEYMNQLLGTGDFSSEAKEAACEVVLSVSWIPVFASSVETVETEYALFPGVVLQPPFHRVHLTGCRPFLLAMGCRERPTLDSMTRELRKYEIFSESDIPAILALLEEISTYRPNFDPHTLVPCQNGRAYSVHDVYYRDSECLLPSALQDKFATHSCISRDLSGRLDIQTLSSLVLNLGEDHFDEDEQMGVVLLDRIQGFLREYDIQYALNEFLANADDAGACKFSIMLDCRRPSLPRSGIISPKFHELQSHASVVLFNNAKLSEDDFKGLRRVGRGGKVGNNDTHGRHGLGALSFYYFADVVTVISGEYVMILDPSGSYLPLIRQGGKRTALIRRISDICRQYPNHLCPYDSLYGFSKDSGFYDGTLFCLPLNTKISAERCDEERMSDLLDSSYRKLAENAFFFTHLEEIRAEVLSASSDRPSLIWSLFATRTKPSSLTDGHAYHFLHLTSGQNHQTEEWIISTSAGNQVPKVHEATASGLALTLTNLIVQLAIRLTPTMGLKSSSSLFSTLHLPRTTSFPFHLNSRFAISSNRQSIVFDSPDILNARDPKTDYNAWILTDVVPPLYLGTLTFLIQKHVKMQILTRRPFWLLKSGDGEDMYRHTADAFHSLLANSDNLLFKSVDGSLLSFKNSVFSKSYTHPKEIVDTLTILVAPRLVVDYSSSGIATLSTARTIDPLYTKGILRDTPLEIIQCLYSEGMIKLDHMLQSLLYVSKELDLVGLPLLVLSTNTPISVPGKMDRCIYLSKELRHAKLFNNIPFLHPAFSQNAFNEIWLLDSVNVTDLTVNVVNQLIRNQLNHTDGDEKEAWLEEFWSNYHTLPGPPSLTALEQADLKLVRGSLCQYSLLECRPQQVVYFRDSGLRRVLSPALLVLGIDVIQPTSNLTLMSHLDKGFPSPLVNILNCLAARNICDFRGLPAGEDENFLTWFKSAIKSNIWGWQSASNPGIDRQHLFRLKIWPAYTSLGEDLHSASDLGILPHFFDISTLIPYLQHRPITSYSSTLRDVTMFCRSLPATTYRGKKKKKIAVDISMTPENILDSIRFPPSVNGLSELMDFKAFLRCFFEFGTASLAGISLSVFDTEGRMQLLNQLYDHTVPIFSTTLAYTTESFVHPILRDVDLQAMRRLGLRFQISFDSFRSCITAVQHLLQSHNQGGGPTPDELMNMSKEAFQCYNDCLPSLIMSNHSKWAILDDIKFVRPKNIRRQGASYLTANYYKGEQGPLLAPKHFVIPKLEPIVWTQRALFFDEPSENLVALNTKLGVPEVWEVVAHLKVLTTEIAPNHPFNSTLLSDIKATYKWLNDNAEQAQDHILHLEAQGMKLFLNVDNPSEDWWGGNWVMAKEVVLNLHYDYEGVKRVKVFLQDYSTLLRASGCITMALIGKREHAVTDLSSKQSDIMKVFNEMRKAGEVVDVVLVPTFDFPIDVLNSLDSDGVDMEQDEQESEELGVHNSSDLAESGLEQEAEEEITAYIPDNIDPELRAHRVILAASIPFIRDWAEGWKHNKLGELALVEFNGTSFGAKCLLDFIYTGDFDYVTPANEFEGMKNLLYELLALLPIADEWNMPNLKAQVETDITYEPDLVQCLLPFHEQILKVAERFQANDLKKALNELSKGNEQLMKKLKKAV